MINFETDICPQCGRKGVLMKSNNPLSGKTICFSCIANNLNYKNMEHAEFFCRTYNLPWDPQLWITLSEEFEIGVFRKYTEIILEKDENKPNLVYSSSTKDLWSRTNKEWEKCRSFTEVLKKINTIKDSYVTRGALKWGTQYTFEDMIKLDSIYTRTIKANNIINPLQKEAVKALCKLHIEMDEAIAAKDAKALKDYSTSYKALAEQADLENMIQETKTSDITTVAELYDFMEKSGFKPNFYDGFDRDEVDRAIKDITETNRRLVLESTGLQPLLEEMAKKRMETAEQEHTAAVVEDTSLKDLLEYNADDVDIETESDEDVLNQEFEEEKKEEPKIFLKDK